MAPEAQGTGAQTVLLKPWSLAGVPRTQCSGVVQTHEASRSRAGDSCRTAWIRGAAQTIITTAATSISRPAAPVNQVDLARELLTIAVMFRTRFPDRTPLRFTVEIAPRDSDGAGPQIWPGGLPPPAPGTGRLCNLGIAAGLSRD
jgi:hypothetical protein